MFARTRNEIASGVSRVHEMAHVIASQNPYLGDITPFSRTLLFSKFTRASCTAPRVAALSVGQI